VQATHHDSRITPTPHFILDARTATPHFPGIGRYVGNLARALVPLLAPDERLTVIYDPIHPIALPSSDAVRTLPHAISPFSLRQQWAIPRLLRGGRWTMDDGRRSMVDGPSSVSYHSPYIAMPYLPGVPALLTVYDLIPLRYPEHSTPRARLFVRWMTRLALRAARHVIAISEFTRRDYLAEFDLPPERINVIPLAADPTFRPQPPAVIAELRARCGLPQRFALYLGSNKPHKNLVRLVEAWQIAQSRFQLPASSLVIAGAWDARYPEARQRAEAVGLTDGIQWLGTVPEADLPALYAAATAFVFPSLYEGFGLPVLEAMACGTPVICSNTSSLPEVTSPPGPRSSEERGGNSAAILVDPLDTGALAAAMTHALTDEGMRRELKRRGLAQAARFSWPRTAAETLAVYRQVSQTVV
jgi:alpha-1,3-rhamnosyl/mannosyltransferase